MVVAYNLFKLDSLISRVQYSYLEKNASTFNGEINYNTVFAELANNSYLELTQLNLIISQSVDDFLAFSHFSKNRDSSFQKFLDQDLKRQIASFNNYVYNIKFGGEDIKVDTVYVSFDTQEAIIHNRVLTMNDELTNLISNFDSLINSEMSD